MDIKENRKKRLSLSLRAKMLLYFGIAFAAAIAINEAIILYGIPFTDYHGAYRTEQARILQSLSDFADSKKTELQGWLDDRSADTKNLTGSGIFKAQVSELCSFAKKAGGTGIRGKKLASVLQKEKAFRAVQQKLSVLTQSYSAYEKIQVAGKNGMVIVSTETEDLGMDVSESLKFRKVLNPVIDEFVDMEKNEKNNKLYLFISSSINDSGGKPLAVVIMYSKADSIIEPMPYTGSALGKTGEVVLVNQDSKILTSLKYPLPDGSFAKPLEYINPAKPARLSASGIEGVLAANDYRGKRVLAATRYIRITSEIGWGMVVKIDETEVFAPIRQAVFFNLTTGVVICGIMLLVIYFIASNLSAPLKSLSISARRIEEGDFDERAHISGGDEVGMLAESFNSMAERIQNWHRDLEARVRLRTEQLNVLNEELSKEIAERRLVEEALKREKETAQKYLDIARVMIVVINADQTVALINKSGCETMGYQEEEISGKNWFYNFLPEEEIAGAKKVFGQLISGHAEPVEYYENRILTKDGRERLIAWHNAYFTDSSGRIAGTISSGEDITETRILEEQLRQSQKMESIGQLAGGVAHDFNNILTAIIGYANLMRMKLRGDDPLVSYVDEILSSSESAANLTRGLLAFSRKQIIDPQPVNLNDLVRGLEKLLRRIIGEDIELETFICDDELPLMADKAQLEQVIMNLCANARDSMPEGGLLTIETSLFNADESYARSHLFEATGTYAVLSVSDTGAGMDENTKERIFEPFFTTKDIGRGTGLGLSIVHGTVKQHNGYINVYSEPGKGTNFRIYFPVIKSETALKNMEVELLPQGGTETILVAEDKADVKKMIKTFLEEFGYEVLEADNGEEAVRIYAENREKIKLALLDVIMPKMNGREAYEEIKKTAPDVKALFMSGYSADIINRKGIVENGLEFMSKPVPPYALLRRIRHILDSERRQP